MLTQIFQHYFTVKQEGRDLWIVILLSQTTYYTNQIWLDQVRLTVAYFTFDT